MTKKVEFPGHGTFWLMDDGPLGYLHQFDEQGDLKIEHMFDASYAHMFDGVIKRFGQAIGLREDLRPVE